ncbi:MAG: Fe-S protein assembly co-chaperone HscB [Phycisphaeraceae bacterium]
MTPDPFDILNLPRRFDLDPNQLHARFIQASAANHPDRFTDPVRQAEAAEKAAQINHAYAVLSDPEKRADALLTLLGGPAKEDDKSLPPDLLMDMMETRERLEDAIAENNQAELDSLRDWANQQRQQHLDRIADLFAQHPQCPLPSDTAKAIRLELNTLRYIQRMLDQMPQT